MDILREVIKEEIKSLNEGIFDFLHRWLAPKGKKVDDILKYQNLLDEVVAALDQMSDDAPKQISRAKRSINIANGVLDDLRLELQYGDRRRRK